ncbi:MAG: response regulator [Planctomycetota bacterium]
MPKILLVDDSRIMLRLVGNVVAEVFPGAEMETASTGEEALQKVRDMGQPLDLALIDYNMPGMNGIECGAQLRTLQPQAKLALCTANAQNAVAQRAQDVGLGVIHKPIDAAGLRSLLESLGVAAPTTASPELELTPDQVDALKEAFNLGVGQAARSLGQLVEAAGEIELSVPDVQLIPIGDLCRAVSAEDVPVCAVEQTYTGPFGGSAYLIYSAEESLQLARFMIGSTAPIDALSEMESDALCEIGNIVLNACISTFGNMFGVEIGTGTPRILNDTAIRVLTQFGRRSLDDRVLYLRMGFSLLEGQLEGHLGFTMDVAALAVLLRHVDEFLAGV